MQCNPAPPHLLIARRPFSLHTRLAHMRTSTHRQPYLRSMNYDDEDGVY